MLEQIVLKTTESDIHEFYVGVLGGKITSTYTLNMEDAMRNFNIPQQVKVYELKLQKMQFQLTVYEAFELDSLEHLLLPLNNVSEIFKKACEKNYCSHLQKKGERISYFIQDNNNNLFELQNKMQYHEQYIG